MDSGVLAETLARLSWREALIAIIALLLLYVLVVFLRMWHLRRARNADGAVEPLLAQAAVAAYAAAQEPQLSAEAPAESTLGNVVATASASTAATAAATASIAASTTTPARPVEPEFAWNEPPPEIPGQQMINALERHVYQLRGEIGDLRADLLEIREEVRRELAQAQAAHSVSPLYSDAMQMAIKGHDAATVSERCGIARAEAELVVSLVRNRADANWAANETSMRTGMENGQ